ncbi:MAG: hypothetical protein HXY37_08735, partial [Chloroflexi bacterium]|nr:hypothetical protein [Chloroflexota bacterium]
MRDLLVTPSMPYLMLALAGALLAMLGLTLMERVPTPAALSARAGRLSATGRLLA